MKGCQKCGNYTLEDEEFCWRCYLVGKSIKKKYTRLMQPLTMDDVEKQIKLYFQEYEFLPEL